MADLHLNSIASRSGGIIDLPTGHRLKLTDDPTADDQAANLGFMKNYFKFARTLSVLANAKVTLAGNTLTLTTEDGAIGAANPIGIPIPKSALNGETDYRFITSAIALVLPSGTVNQRIAGIDTRDGFATFASAGLPTDSTASGIEWFLYYINDGTDRIGLSRSPNHNTVPANYAHTLSAGTITPVASADTAWDAMLVSGGAIGTPSLATCVCLGPVITATVSGGSSSAGWFSAVSLTSNFVPKVGNKQSTIGSHAVRIHTVSGYGSSDTKIPTFGTIISNNGTAIQYFSAGGTVASGGVGGAEFRITEDGIYAFKFVMNGTGQMKIGLSRSSVALSSSIDGITLLSILDINTTAGANFEDHAIFVGPLTAGEIVRPHTDGTAVGTGLSFFECSKVK